MSLLRCLQTCTAAAALFALLGACGLAPPRSTRVIVRPRPPRSEVTIRSLTGTWDAEVAPAIGCEMLVLALRQTGDRLTGSLTVRGRTVASASSPASRLDGSGAFALQFGLKPEYSVAGRPDASGERIRAWVAGIGPDPIRCDFRRR